MSDLPTRGSVQYGTTRIDYSIRPATRKTLAIHVFPDGSVITDAPRTATEDEIAAKVKSRGAWVLKQQRTFAAYPPAIPARRYVSGEEVRYLGRQYRLKLLIGLERSAKLKGAHLEVTLLAQDGPDAAKKLVDTWLRERADAIFNSLMGSCVERASRIGVNNVPEWRMLRMKKRWGSCTNSGTLILNPELVAAPKDCIEYVILHELCHLRVRNHSIEFYRQLSRVVPKWEHLRMKLNRAVELRLEY
ncbi:MAG: M48 family metallopeptidase [Pseudodesulfovibrio sp.]|nr:M48 family metallopeptidase [Pseudodesulfovibrio sp.]